MAAGVVSKQVHDSRAAALLVQQRTDSNTLAISPAFGSGRVLWVPRPVKHHPQAAWELGVLVHTARELDVPAICVVLVWASPGTASYVIGVHATGMAWFNGLDRDDFSCDDCGDPCDDADLRMEANARDQNCVRCNPCSLCSGCSVHISRAKVCLSCATDTEALELSESKQRRRRLVGEIATQWRVRDPLH